VETIALRCAGVAASVMDGEGVDIITGVSADAALYVQANELG
jgi:hypothetical protein